MPNIERFYDVDELRIGDKVRILKMDECDIFTRNDCTAFTEAINMMSRSDQPGDYYVVSIEKYISDSMTGVRLCIGEPRMDKEWSYPLRPDFLAPFPGEFYEGRHVKQHKVADVSDRLLWQTLRALNAAMDSEDIHADLSAIIKRIDDHFKS